MMFADRSIINVHYPKDHNNSNFTVICSSLNTKSVEEAQKDRIGKDVIMTNHLNYINLNETYGEHASIKCQWTSITAHELEGFASQQL